MHKNSQANFDPVITTRRKELSTYKSLLSSGQYSVILVCEWTIKTMEQSKEKIHGNLAYIKRAFSFIFLATPVACGIPEPGIEPTLQQQPELTTVKTPDP